ncbi:hypothetical protein O3M35_012326 [Rhynocoris fuscipes]|uniref:Uncharacterized protein n=1 Tax=Rhynocoris fuscipes TaxID=488301 RepID=A0AAW1CUH8_9HEMI
MLWSILTLQTRHYSAHRQLSLIALLVCVIDKTNTVTFPKSSTNFESSRAHYTPSSDDEDLNVCLRSDNPLLPCLTSSMVQGIETAGGFNTVSLANDLRLIQESEHEKFTLTGDRREARTLLEAITMYMEPRYLQWDLSEFYPGLVMTVGPTSRGYLQFFLDKRRTITDERSLSTGRLIVKRTILPVLLGIKLNVASLAPILIAGIILLVKKIFIFSKLSFILAAIGLYLNYRRPVGGHGGSFASSSSSSGLFGGSGLGSFAGGPKKHSIIIERPTNHWFAKEEPDPLETTE